MIVDFLTDEGEGGSEIRSLETWLAEDPMLRTATVRVEQTGDSLEDMGVGGELLRVVLEPGVLTAVATVAGAWLASRSMGTRLRLRKGEVEVEVSTRPGQDAEEIAIRILKELKET
jgi:hypothetical protein